MKGILRTLMAGVIAILLIPLTGFQPSMAAPTGEIKLVGPLWGHEVPIPRLGRADDLDWMKLLYDSLVGTTPDGQLSTEMGLAHKWEMSPDGLTWTFYIRKGVKFHDGAEVTANDVKASIEEVVLPDSQVGIAGAMKAALKSVEVKDPYTLVIHCKEPTLFLAAWLSDIDSPAGMVIHRAYYNRVGKDQFQRHPIGSGPYKWHSQMVGSFIKLEATDRHWRDGVPRYKYMSFRINLAL